MATDRMATEKIRTEMLRVVAGSPRSDEQLTGVETILIVEDRSFVRNVACEVLRAAGYRVSAAKNAAEAVRIYEQGVRVDLLVADIVLPGENGRMLAARLKRGNPGLKVLLITGYPALMDLGGAECCLAKPFSSAALLRRVRQVLDCGSIQMECAHESERLCLDS